MDQHLELIGAYIEKSLCFNKFKPLIHQACRINRDLLSHAPIRMLDRLSHSCPLHLFVGPGAEWAAGSGQRNRFNTEAIT